MRVLLTLLVASIRGILRHFLIVILSQNRSIVNEVVPIHII